MQTVVESGRRLNITATNAALAQGYLMGVFVAQASNTPTLKVADGDGTIANTFTPVAGTYYRLPCQFKNTLTVTISGTVDATLFYIL
jgi:hypothetical protein